MKTFSTFLGIVFGIAILAALLAGGYFLFIYAVDAFNYMVNAFGTLEPQLKAITIIASVIALLCALIIASGLKKVRSQKESSSGKTVEKAKIYERLLAFWCEQLKKQTGGEESVAHSELIKLEQLLALHGSPKVITAYAKLRRLESSEGKPDDELPELLKKLVLEMRRDLGRMEFNLKKNDLLDLLLSPNTTSIN